MDVSFAYAEFGASESALKTLIFYTFIGSEEFKSNYTNGDIFSDIRNEALSKVSVSVFVIFTFLLADKVVVRFRTFLPD